MSNQRSASGPSARRARSERWARWATRRQKSRAGPVTRCGASSGPYAHTSPEGETSSTRKGSGGAGSPCTLKAKSRVRTPIHTTCLSRSVGVRTTPSASAMSRPWAQVSMSRAVAMEAPDIGGRTRGTWCRAVPRAMPCRGRCVLPASAPTARRAAARPLLRAVVDERPRRHQRLLHQRAERLRVGHRQQCRVVRPGEVCDLVGDAPAGRRSRECPLLGAQLGYQPVEFLALVAQIVEHGRRIGHGALPSGHGGVRGWCGVVRGGAAW